MKHIDEWLDEPPRDENECLAKEWLEHFRRPAIDKDHDWLGDRVVTCTYQGESYRCIGASRMGDVWLTSHFDRVNGYDLRVYVDDCSNWAVHTK
jgi:hypothetical protein